MLAPYYAILFVKLDRVVQRFGWALTLHGTMARDLDLVLIPWTADAEHEDKVIDAVRIFVEGKILYSFPKSMSDAHIWSAVDFAMRMCALVEQEYTRPKKLPL